MELSEYSKQRQQYWDLRREKRRLEHEKKMAPLRAMLHQIDSISNQVAESLNGIRSSMEVIVQHQDALVDMLSDDKPHISMPAESARQFSKIVPVMKSMLVHPLEPIELTGLENCDYKEFPIDCNRSVESVEKTLKNCQILLENVKKYEADANKIDDDSETTLNTHECRERASIVSENSLMNTFQSNNVSASSSINDSIDNILL